MTRLRARIGSAVVVALVLLVPTTAHAFINPNPVNDPNAATDQAFSSASDQMAPSLAVLGGNVVSAWDDNGSPAGFVGYGNSTDNGVGFTDRGDPSAGALHEPDADPIVDTNDTTGAFFMTTPSTQAGEDVQLLRSTDNGATFGSPVEVLSDHEGQPNNFLDGAHMAIDNFAGQPNGNVDVCFRNVNVISENTDEILFNRSINGGGSFGAHPTLISTGGAGCFVAIGPDHSVYVFYYRGTGDLGLTGPSALYVRRSTDRGLTFRPEHVVASLNTTADGGDLQLYNGAQTLAYPHAAINPVTGDMVVAYNDDPNVPNTFDNADVLYVTSDDNGKTWSSPVNVNDETAGDQYEPSVAITPDGTRIMFAYYSTSHDSFHNLIAHRRARMGIVNVGSGQITLRRSFQLGADTPIDDEFARFGEQDGIDATDSDFHTDWSDARLPGAFGPSQPDIWYARIPTDTASSAVTDIVTDLGNLSGSVDVGGSADMQLSVTAPGAQARDVFVSVPPVHGLIYEPAPGSDCWVAGGFLSCTLHDIPPGGTHSVHFDAFATRQGVHTMTATATTADRETHVADNKETEAVSVVNGPPPLTLTYSSGNVSTPIPDSSSVEIPINVSGPIMRRALDVDAVVRLDHTFDQDLVLTLISPSGRQVTLSNENGGSGDNYGTGPNSCAGAGTIFNDSSATSITTASAPFSGSFSPEYALSNMIGEQANGQWKLRVTDTANEDTGTVGCVRLKIRQGA